MASARAALALVFLASIVAPLGAAHAAPPFNRDLAPGVTDPDVSALQAYLNAHGFAIASTGPGAPGAETTYFGTLTKNALVHFQETNRGAILAPLDLLHGTGNFFFATRNFINGHLLSATTTPPASISDVVTPPSEGSSHNTVINPRHVSRSLSTYTLGGTITNLQGSLELHEAGGSLFSTFTHGDLSFTFPDTFSNLFAYAISIFGEPGNQICLLSGGTGTISGGNISSIGVTCYTIPSITHDAYETHFFTYATRNVALTAPVSSSPGAFTYISSNTSIATVSGSTATLVGAGTTTITASQATSSPYASRSVTFYLQAYVDECSTDPCLNGGICSNVPPSSYQCSCQAGYSGTTCELSTYNCDGSGANICYNGGTCTPSITGGECACTLDWTGSYCELIGNPAA